MKRSKTEKLKKLLGSCEKIVLKEKYFSSFLKTKYENNTSKRYFERGSKVKSKFKLSNHQEIR